MKRLLLTFAIIYSSFSGFAQYNKEVILQNILKTDTTSIGQKIVYPNFANDEVSIVKETIPPGKATGWHKHVFPVFGYVLQGTLTVEIENRKANQYLVGTSFSEVINTLLFNIKF